jgi:hypothetical protein
MAETRRKHDPAALALAVARGATVRGAAKALSIPERSAYRMATGADFRAEVTRLRSEVVDRTVGRLAARGAAAVAALGKLLKDGNATVRLRAATSILESLVRLREHSEVVARLEALEETAREHQRETQGR